MPVRIVHKFESIHALRGVAAMAVAVSHLPSFIHAGTGIPPGWDAIAAGKAGVDVFFVISGFVMTITTTSLSSGWRTGWSFLWRRIVRIVPLYWTVTLFLVTLFVFDRRFGAERSIDLDLVFRSLFFIPIHGPDGSIRPIVGVGWSLNYEMYFYLCVATVVACVPQLYRLTVLALVMSAAYLGARCWMDPRVDWVINAGLAFEFLLGVLAATIYNHRLARLVGLALGCITIIAAWPSLTHLHPVGPGLDRTLSWGAIAFVLVLVLTSAEHRRPWQRTPGLGAIGDASYALYLTHSLSFAAIQRLASLVDGLSLLLQITAMLLLSILVSLMVHRWFERPIIASLTKMPQGR